VGRRIFDVNAEYVLTLCGRTCLNGTRIQVGFEEPEMPDTNASIASVLLRDRAELKLLLRFPQLGVVEYF
jgi:hypothetical protein